MKVNATLFFALIAMTAVVRADDPTVQELQDQVSDAMKAKNKEVMDQYNEDMKEFERQVIEAVNQHQSSVKRVKVGEFVIKIQDNCEIEWPEKPEKPTITEEECIKAHFDAETTANLISKATPLNPPNVQMVMQAMNTCKLQVSWVKQFEIYNNCWEGEIPAMYKPIFEAQRQSLIDQGYEEEHLENGGTRWVKSGEKKTINLIKEGNDMIVHD